MTQPDFTAMMKRLADGETLASVLEAVRPEGEPELLKRCAAVHDFDEGLFEVLRTLNPAVGGIELDTLLASGAIQRVPGYDGRYRVPASTRDDYYKRWWSEDRGAVIPSALRELSAAVLGCCQDREGWEVEALYHELIVDRREATRRFQALYGAADAAFDLPRCEDLLGVLTERLPLLGPETAELANRYRRRLRSRTMWKTDWYRSARFLPPGGSENAVDALLSGDPSRVLVLWSAGGMGKSSHLRWLISRHCVPGDDACARIDFEDIDPLLATREPAAVLLEAAYQLDQQLPEAPFHELLVQYAGHRERLRGGAGAAGNGAGDVVERFTAVMRDLPCDRRVVIALDTLERALLVGGPRREQTDLAPLLRQLAGVVTQAPALRLVLASRYALSDRVREFSELFPDARELPVPAFTAEESRRYLTEYRGIEREDVVERLANNADGVPFKLELLADYAEDHPDLDPDELTEYAQADLHYVIERIVSRLEPELQTLVRYGVAPRVLERRFVREVLAPLLGDPGLESLWPQLKAYAGTASWVELEPGDVDAVRFHEAVLDPLRKLLEEDARELHRRATEWFEQRARDQPDAATRWLCEAVYHRFQYEGPAAAKYWAGLIREARTQQRAERRRSLAAEVLRDDYTDQPGLIGPETVLRARWELAVAALQLAGDDTPERREAERLEAQRALTDLHHLLAEEPETPLSDAEMALLEAAVRLGDRDLAGAEPYIDVALGGELSQTDRLWLSLAHAEAVASADPGESISVFHTALGIADAGEQPAADRAVVLMRMARHEAQRDRFDEAVADCELAAATADGGAAIELNLLRAELDRRVGAPSRALERLASASCEEPEIEARRDILRIRALLAAARPVEALELAERASARFSDRLQLGGARQRAVAAEGRELRGKVRAALLDVDGAIRDFEEAAARWSQLASTEAVCRCRIRSAELHLHGTRDINKVEVQLDQARRSIVQRGEDAWTRRMLLGAELLAEKGRQTRAESLVDGVIETLRERRHSPRALIDAAQRGLALSGDAAQERYLALLCEQVALVTPPAARLALLKPLERCPVLTAPAPLRERLRELVPSPLSEPSLYADVPPADRALLLLLDADVERVARHADTARRILHAAWEALGPAAPPIVRHEVLKAAGRLGDRTLLVELAPALEGERSPTPLLAASMLLRTAEAIGPGEERTRLLGAAWSRLSTLGAAAGGWLATALELEADEAERAGDGARARAERRRAVERYDALGDDLRARTAAVDDGGTAPADAESLLPDEARVTVRLRPDELTISVRRLDQPRTVQRLTVEPPVVRALLDSGAAAAGRAGAPEIVRQMLDEPHALAEQLAELLVSAVGRDAGGRGLDLGLRSKDSVIRALPWELAAPALEPAGIFLFRRAPRTRGTPADIRAFQSTLRRLGTELVVDGILGQRTVSAISAFQERHGLPVTGRPDELTAQRLQALATGDGAPWVAVVRPPQGLEISVFRGTRQSGVPVDWHYELAGYRVMVLEGPTRAELKTALERRPVAVLHLNAGFVDHHGTPAVDLVPFAGPAARTSSAGRLTGTALDSLLPGHAMSPLVILDAAAPRTRRELATQLLLRNAFAAELVSVGTVRGVLATGLRHYGRQKRLIDALIEALARGADLRELFRAALSADAGSEATLPLPPALFARTPGLRYPAPWR